MLFDRHLGCKIFRETDYHRYNSYKSVVGKMFENTLVRDFKVDGPQDRLCADVTKFRQKWGKAYLTSAYDFGSKQIVA